MSISNIPPRTLYLLWGKSGGRCEFAGCNIPLYYDNLTKVEFNNAYTAHIIADKPNGPRGDRVLSKKYCKDISNLMIMCDNHHRLIDKEDVEGYSAELLQEMKKEHEERIELLTSIHKEKRSHVILFGANIGSNNSTLNKNETYEALFPLRYPASKDPIELGMKNSSFNDANSDYWEVEEKNLITLFKQKVKFVKDTCEVNHFSIFGLAPQPLLIKLGTLLCDLYPADIYQRHREPTTWIWQNESKVNDFILNVPSNITNIPVLKFALSADITDDRIYDIVGKDCSIWNITIDQPNNDFLKTKTLLGKFRERCREALNKIKTAHGENILLHVFPAMPVSAAVEFGRVWMPKADLPLIIYDQNNEKNGFIKTLEIKSEGGL